MDFAKYIALDPLHLTRFFFALLFLLTSAHCFGYFFQRFRFPKVIGEIFGGFLLSPTCLGHFFPSFHTWLFTAFEEEGKLLSVMHWFGLILLMFISGFEIEKKIETRDRKITYFILFGSTFIPLLAGWIAPSLYDFTPYIGVKQNMLAFQIIIAIAVAVTSIPVISKIFIDLDIMGSRFARIILATATAHDVLLWVLLAIATGLVSTQRMSSLQMMSNVGLTILFFGGTLLFGLRFFQKAHHSRFNILRRASSSGYILLVCFSFVALASFFEVNIVFGALLAGIVIGTLPQDQFCDEKKHIKDFSLSFFVPLYFSIVGLKLDLLVHFSFHLFLWFLLFSSLCQGLGTMLAAKASSVSWRSSFNLAVAMNTRGGPGIVLATVALELGIIDETFFSALVLVAIATALFGGYWFRFVLQKGWPLLEET